HIGHRPRQVFLGLTAVAYHHHFFQVLAARQQHHVQLLAVGSCRLGKVADRRKNKLVRTGGHGDAVYPFSIGGRLHRSAGHNHTHASQGRALLVTYRTLYDKLLLLGLHGYGSSYQRNFRGQATSQYHQPTGRYTMSMSIFPHVIIGLYGYIYSLIAIYSHSSHTLPTASVSLEVTSPTVCSTSDSTAVVSKGLFSVGEK